MYKTAIFKKISRFAFLLVLISLLLTALASCSCTEILESEPPTKEELYANVEADRAAKKTVMHHIYEWGFPSFNTNKFGAVESLVIENYYEKMPDNLTVATSVANKFLSEYYDKTDLENATAVTDALLKCYMRSIGDDYAVYRVISEQQVFQEDISGGASYVGVGIQVRRSNEGYPFISAVYSGSGAEAAGVRAYDFITAVDGKSVSELGYQDAIDLLRGEEGTSVEITVLRGGVTHTLSVERRALTEASVISSFDEETGFAYISIMSFKGSTPAEFKAIIDSLEEKGVRGIVFDLRGNPGGLVDAVLKTVSYLAEDGLPFISYNTHEKELESERTALELDSHKLYVPMVVLVNEGTASAAELFTAALRDYRDCPELGAKNKNITIVGTKTFGKGIRQSSRPIGDGTYVTFTTAYYNPPSGVNYHGVGISPDEGYSVEWSLTLADGDVQLNRAYEALAEYFADAAA